MSNAEEHADYVRQIRVAERIAKENIIYWVVELQHRHDQAQKEVVHEDDYQMGYLHGLTSAITFLDERIADIDKHDEQLLIWLKELEDDKE